MINSSPISSPPPELVQQWWEATMPNIETSVKDQLCTQAARWGADQELEACCTELHVRGAAMQMIEFLRAARRPKPPSLKEQALEVVTGLEKRWDLQCDLACLRRAIEALPND